MTTATPYQMIDGEITAIDLRSEIQNITQEYPGIEVETAHILVGNNAEHAQAVFFPALGRAGIAWGADAEWTDAKSMVEAVRLWQTGEMVN